MPITWAFGVLVLLAVLGAAGPGAPVTAVTALPPPDTTAFGATGRLPDPTPPPVPDALATALPTGSPEPSGSGLGIPETVLAAYRSAATTVDRAAPGCRLTWPLVAGIGKIESGHASGGAVDADGTTLRPILGPQLTGTGGNAAIRDTDGGALDHDVVWDRAVGPTQFIPSNWRTYGADGNGDGLEDPDNVFDAGLATARYLCSGGGDLSRASARHDAVFRYNHSEAYVATVLRWADAYASGALPAPDSTEPTWTGETLADAAPTLAALPQPSAAGGAGPGASPSAAPAPAGPVIASSGATRPGIGATRSPSPDLAAAAAGPTPGTTTPGATPPSATPPSATPPSATPPSATAPPSTPPSATAPPSTPGPAAAPSPAKPAAPTPAPPTPSITPPASTSPPTTTTTTTVDPATTCAAAIPTVARVLGMPAGHVTASGEAGPGVGRTTCTLRSPHGPLLVAVTAAAGAPAPATPATGVSRTVGRTILTVPPTAGVPADTARTALATIAAAWS